MKIAVFACSVKAYELMKRLENIWKSRDESIEITCVVKCKSLENISVKESLGECVGKYFNAVDGLVFISATGIAVRSIAKYINHKGSDPAVVVVDESGKFCISLLSGHSGGANALAKNIADLIGAMPVITTATDVENKFAVDDFARKNKLKIVNWKKAKEISVDILEGKKKGIFSELPVVGNIPKELYFADKSESDIVISYYKSENALQLIPKIIAVGVGCKKNTESEKIAFAIGACLKAENILPDAVFCISSIDLKKNEKGIIDYCDGKGLPFITFSAEKLQVVEGDFSKSDFVKNVTGVSNVCERSAVCASNGRLICRKKVYDGVTVALAEVKGSVSFE
jgi:cobalt-precorrin 5A hydrolase